MNAVAKMRQAGFGLAITERGGLWIEPASRLTTAQREFVKAHKVLLLAELRAEAANDPPMVPPPPMVEFDQDAFEERAAILEFEAGFSRDEAERRAMALMTPVVDPAAPPMVVDLPFATTALEFADRQSAFNWIINNQLGRRNLHPDQASYLRGKRYNAEKQAQGGTGANQHVQSSQNDNSAKTHERLAEEYKVSPATITRDGNYAAAVDTLQKAGIEPQTVIAHESKSAVVEFAKLITPEPELPPTPLLPPVPPKPKDPLAGRRGMHGQGLKPSPQRRGRQRWER